MNKQQLLQEKKKKCKHEYRMAKEGNLLGVASVPYVFYCIKCLEFKKVYMGVTRLEE